MLILAALLFSSPSPAATTPQNFAQVNLWNFEELTPEDWMELESIYIQQRIEAAHKMRVEVQRFARRNGGLKEISEWSYDNLEGAPTNIDFSTNNGKTCQAATYQPKILCN